MAASAPLIGQLEVLARDAISDIERLQDFQVFTGHSYDRYSKMVSAGHLKESVQNVRTKSTLPGTDLAKVLLGYLDDDLPRVVLYQAVADYEAFFFAFLAVLLRINPRALSLKRQVTVEDILDAADFDTVLERLIQRELHELQYRSVPEWFDFLARIVKLDGVTAEDIARLAELKATRDIHLHNGGIANDTYLRKAGLLARVSSGNRLPVPRPYVYDGADFLKAFIARKAASARTRFAPAA